jgi:hypothetical protein
MASISLSPSVQVLEQDFSSTISQIATSITGTVGYFHWGPVLERTLVTNERDLIDGFAKPDDNNFKDFYVCDQFLKYGNILYLVRALDDTTPGTTIGNGGLKVVDSTTGTGGTPGYFTVVKNDDDTPTPAISFGGTEPAHFITRYPADESFQWTPQIKVATANYTDWNTSVVVQKITLADATNFIPGENIASTADAGVGVVLYKSGNDVYVSITSGSFAVSDDVDDVTPFVASETTISAIASYTTWDTNIETKLTVADASSYSTGSDVSSLGDTAIAKVLSVSGNVLSVRMVSGIFVAGMSIDDAATYTAEDTTISTVAVTKFVTEFEYAPADTTQYAICVIVDDVITEKHIVSRTTTAKNDALASIYVDDWILNNSAYIHAYDNTGNSNEIDSIEATQLTGGNAEAPLAGDIQDGYDLFANAEEFDINIIMDGANNDATTHAYILDNITDVRKDCVLVMTPPSNLMVNVASNGTIVTNLTTYKKTTLAKTSSYGAIYGNWKYMDDKHNSKKRWIPVSGDVAGAYVITDETRDAWFAPAGYTRGIIKNVIKFAWNPNKPQRDLLYKDQVNPVFKDESFGVNVILGQKNLMAIQSAFNRVDTRRLFIVLEKSISTFAKNYLFEKNNEFTRKRFKGQVDPFLRDIQGREGIDEFLVVVDSTNNTATVLNNNQFVGDIYIKPTPTSEYIKLTFFAVAQGVSFQELIGSP